MTDAINTCQHNLKKILLATDFSGASQAAFQAALLICSSSGASLSILNVFEYAGVAPPETSGQPLESDSFYQAAEQSLDTLIQEACSHGVHSEGSMTDGIPHTSILEAAKASNVNLIVLGTRSIHGFERLVFGSTAEAVLRKAICPVFTVGPQAAMHVAEAQAEGGIVLFATDFHVATIEALRDAASFATMLHLPLHCLHVLPRAIEDGTHKGAVPPIIIEALQHLVVELHEVLAPPVCAVTYGSEISNAVVEYARIHNAKLIVLGVRRKSIVASHIPAHIAYRVITEAPCPVLTMAFPRETELAGQSALQCCEANAAYPMMVQ